MPSPSPITPSTSYPPPPPHLVQQQNPQFHFPTVPPLHRPRPPPPIRHSHSQGILKHPPSPTSLHVRFAPIPPQDHHRHRSNSSNNLFASSGPHNHLIKPPPTKQHTTSPHHKRLTKPTPTPHPDFQYSKCTGRRKALCVRPPFLPPLTLTLPNTNRSE